MLEADERVFVQVFDGSTSDDFRVLLHQHPADMGVEEAVGNGVWVLKGVRWK